MTGIVHRIAGPRQRKLFVARVDHSNVERRWIEVAAGNAIEKYERVFPELGNQDQPACQAEDVCLVAQRARPSEKMITRLGALPRRGRNMLFIQITIYCGSLPAVTVFR